jgi:hypothetical protein
VVRGEKMKKETKEEECKWGYYLVVKNGKFFIEECFDDESYVGPFLYAKEHKSERELAKSIFGDNNVQDGRYPLRNLLQSEKEDISNDNSVYIVPGATKRSKVFQYMLDRCLDTVIVLDHNEFNKRFKRNKLTKPVIIIQGKFSLFD